MSNITQTIKQIALELLEASPEGLRHHQLLSRISSADSSLKAGTIATTVSQLDQSCPGKVHKPSRGLFRLVEFADPETDQLKDELVPKASARIREEQFYAPFADWLQNDREECTKAIELGGKRFHDKWGTPDVIGIRVSRRSDVIQAPVEIVSAEIKPEISQLVTAFGQACCYCLFSHKSYLVVPQQTPPDETARMDSLCQVFGIGLVLFDASNPQDPDFAIRVSPRKQDPDLFYTNKYMKLIEGELFPR